MTVKEFTVLLASELMDRGIDKTDAATHVLTLAKTLTEEDLKEITGYKTSEDFVALSDSLAQIIKEKIIAKQSASAVRPQESAVEPEHESAAEPMYDAAVEPEYESSAEPMYEAAAEPMYDAAVEPEHESASEPMHDAAADENAQTAIFSMVDEPEEFSQPSAPVREEPADDSTRTFDVAMATSGTGISTNAGLSKVGGTREITAANAPTAQIPIVSPVAATTEPQEIILGDDSTVKEKTVLTRRGKTIFALSILLTSPLWILFLAATGALFVLSVCAVCAVIAAVFVVVLAEIAAGGGGFFVGLIYGTVKIFGGYTGTGLYEIGIGVACVGITFILSFLTYSVASKTMPYVLKEVLAFWGVAFRRAEQLTERFREECNRL